MPITQQTNGLTSSLVPSRSPSLGSGSTAINTVEVIVIVTIGGFLVFLILVIVALTPLLYLLLCTKPKRTGKNNHFRSLFSSNNFIFTAIEDKNFVLPQNMISNDHYVMDDASDHIYEVIKFRECSHSEKTESSVFNEKESDNLSKTTKFNDYRLQREDSEYVEMSALSNSMAVAEDDNRLQES